MTKEEKKIKNKEWNDNKKAAIKTMVEFVLSNANDMPDEVVFAAKTCKSQRKSASTKGQKSVIAELFREKKVVHQNELFLDHGGLGRVEVRNLCNNFTRLPDNEKLWIEFNKESGEYTLLGEGPEIPAGYTGYIPREHRYATEDIEDEEDDDVEDDVEDDSEEEYVE